MDVLVVGVFVSVGVLMSMLVSSSVGNRTRIGGSTTSSPSLYDAGMVTVGRLFAFNPSWTSCKKYCLSPTARACERRIIVVIFLSVSVSTCLYMGGVGRRGWRVVVVGVGIGL